jgi:hypothetical protein
MEGMKLRRRRKGNDEEKEFENVAGLMLGREREEEVAFVKDLNDLAGSSERNCT